MADLADEPNMQHVGRREIANCLVNVGERYSNEFADRIRVNAHVTNHFGFDTPLSWRNHTWHHTIPWNVDVRSTNDLRDSMCRLLGVIETVVPQNDGAVIAFAPSPSNPFESAVAGELNYICSLAPAKRRLAALQSTDDGLQADAIEQMLLMDVRMPVAAG